MGPKVAKNHLKLASFNIGDKANIDSEHIHSFQGTCRIYLPNSGFLGSVTNHSTKLSPAQIGNITSNLFYHFF